MASGYADIMDVDAERDGQAKTMDPGSRADKLKARLYSYAPMMAQPQTNSLQFRGVTKSQARRMQNPFGPKVEPLVRMINM